MTTNRIIVILLSLVVAMEGANFYKQYIANRSRPTTREVPVRDAPKGTIVDVKDLPMKGSSDAKVAIVEFSDYECPFCSRYAMGPGKDIEKTFVQTGKVKVVFVNNPLPIHANAKSLAIAAICAGNQGQYWEMHDMLFSTTPKSDEAVLGLIHKLPLDSVTFEQCIKMSSDSERRINRDMQKAKDLQLTGTPSFGIGHIDELGRVSIEKLVVGALPFPIFEKAINDVLSLEARS